MLQAKGTRGSEDHVRDHSALKKQREIPSDWVPCGREDMRLQGRVRRPWLRSCCSHSCSVVAKPFALLVYGLLFLGLSFPTSIVKELAISSDPVAPDCPRVTGKSVSDKSKFTSLTFRKAIVWARWSLPPTWAMYLHFPNALFTSAQVVFLA